MRRYLRKRPSPGTVMGALALFISLSGATYAATGGNFILGQANSAADQTSLTSSATGAPTLNLVNTGGRPAARFQANAGKAVFTVSNSTKIPNLNADKLDGKDLTQLSPAAADGRTANLPLGDDQTVLTANITTAGSSVLLASAALELFAGGLGGGDGGNAECYLRFDGTVNSPTFAATLPDAGLVGHSDSLALMWAQGVGSGAHTVELRCFETTSDTGITVDTAGLTVSAHP